MSTIVFALKFSSNARLIMNTMALKLIQNTRLNMDAPRAFWDEITVGDSIIGKLWFITSG